MSKQPLNPELVRDVVLRECGLTIDDLMGASKTGRITFARSVIATVLREHTDTTMETITRMITGSKRGTTQGIEAIKRMQSGRCDEMAAQITNTNATGAEYAHYVWIRADEAARANAGKRFGREVA
jgi:chromosomal replication initiation ATPase DnaA